VKTILITGAAQGLGKALALEFQGKGCYVIATDLRTDPPGEFAGHERITWYPMDVTSDEAVESLVRVLSSKGITIDIIINNAGIDLYFPFTEGKAGLFKKIFEVNVFGSYRVNQNFLPLVKRPGGMFIHISSESVNLAVPFLPYPVSKKTLEGYVKAFRQEVSFLGMHATMIRPGPIDTDLLHHVEQISYPVKNEAVKKAFLKFAKMAPGNVGKTISPTEVAAFIFRVSQIPRPKAIYKINNDTKLRIAALLPFSLQEKIVLRQLRS